MTTLDTSVADHETRITELEENGGGSDGGGGGNSNEIVYLQNTCIDALTMAH